MGKEHLLREEQFNKKKEILHKLNIDLEQIKENINMNNNYKEETKEKINNFILTQKKLAK